MAVQTLVPDVPLVAPSVDFPNKKKRAVTEIEDTYPTRVPTPPDPPAPPVKLDGKAQQKMNVVLWKQREQHREGLKIVCPQSA